MTADRLVEILISHGCAPERQRAAHPVRDAVHETVHVLQSGYKPKHLVWDREELHEALVAKAEKLAADRIRPDLMLVRFELQARAVEMLACKRLGLDYVIEDWAFIMWRETISSLRINMGEIDDLVDAIQVSAKLFETQRLLNRVFAMRMKRSRKAA